MLSLAWAFLGLVIGLAFLGVGLLLEPVVSVAAVIPLAMSVYAASRHSLISGLAFGFVAVLLGLWQGQALGWIPRRLRRGGGDDEIEEPPSLPDAGTLGRTLTPLRPSGWVECDGRRFEGFAEADEGMIPAGVSVRVVAARGRRLTVRSAPAEPESS